MRKGVVYRFTCLTCKDLGKVAHYHWETSRTMFERISEHLKQISKGNKDSPMRKHHLEHHGDMGGDPKFKIEMVRSFRKPLERQKEKLQTE